MLSTLFAAMGVCVGDGPPQRVGNPGQQHLPDVEVWLVGEHRSTGAREFYLRNLPANTPSRKLDGAIKARWLCEQAHQQLREELGLDHLEARSWQGLHRHALMTMIAFAFLQARRLKAAGRKKEPCPPPQPSLPAIRQAILVQLSQPPPICPHCRRK
ncbi:hypothetical protein GCM10019059_37420 [Camelimonas fluminis]|uniref:DDE family transposase n=1 Tax=Camelimonas fluminis TaxID=1576911 RepID=A0ABV7UFG5_9HYPH|nr:hypothetical protein GCM10019059_37420 [Camelimonas fluminis]